MLCAQARELIVPKRISTNSSWAGVIFGDNYYNIIWVFQTAFDGRSETIQPKQPVGWVSTSVCLFCFLPISHNN